MSIDTLAAWHRLVEQRNATGLDALLSEKVVFHSPILHTPQNGKELTRFYLTAAIAVIGNDAFRYVREVVGERDAALEFVTEVDGIVINGVDLIAWDESGQITDFKVMLRPLKAVNLIHQKMAAIVARDR